jgi:hypothetical protein
MMAGGAFAFKGLSDTRRMTSAALNPLFSTPDKSGFINMRFMVKSFSLIYGDLYFGVLMAF